MDIIHSAAELLRDIVWRSTLTDEDKELPDLAGKVYIVTGASNGIGFEVARLLAGKNATVYIVGRTPSRIEKSVRTLQEEFPDARVESLKIDNLDLSTIKPAIDEFLSKETRLDGIVHNAGVLDQTTIVEQYGYSDILVVNVIAGHVIQKLLDPILIKTARTAPPNTVRIVWVASTASFSAPLGGGVNWADPNKPSRFLKFAEYGQTKALNIYQAKLWAEHHPGSGVVSVSVHPGLITTDLLRNGKGILPYFGRPAILGAYSEIWPLVSPSVTVADNGTFYAPFGRKGYVRADIVKGISTKGDQVWRLLEEAAAPYAG